MTFKAWLIIAIELILSAIIVYILLGKIGEESRRANQAESLAKQRQETINDMQVRQRDVAALDAKYTKELADAKAEKDALQRKLDNGGRVLVKGRCPVSSSTEATGSSGMGNDASIELSDVAGRNVLDIRSGIKQDQSALRTLQEYISTQCLR